MNVHHKHAVGTALDTLERRYGSDWTARWANVPREELLAAWGDELAAFAGRPDALAWALRHLPERAPSAPAFRRLCEGAPRPQLHEPRPDAPTRVPTDAEREALRQLSADVLRDGHLFATTGPGWASRIAERAAAGLPVSGAALRLARAVLELQAQREAARRKPAAPPVPPANPLPELPDYWEPPMAAEEVRP